MRQQENLWEEQWPYSAVHTGTTRCTGVVHTKEGYIVGGEGERDTMRVKGGQTFFKVRRLMVVRSIVAARGWFIYSYPIFSVENSRRRRRRRRSREERGFSLFSSCFVVAAMQLFWLQCKKGTRRRTSPVHLACTRVAVTPRRSPFECFFLLPLLALLIFMTRRGETKGVDRAQQNVREQIIIILSYSISSSLSLFFLF